MKYEITNAKADIKFTVESDLVYDYEDSVAVLGSRLWKMDGWDWRPFAEPGKFYTATTRTGFDVVVALREGDDVVAALFSDGSYNENLPLDTLTEMEPLL